MKALALACLLVIATTARADDYVVQSEDSCLAIAVRVLGDRTQLDALHRLNPQLGALPHRLVPGSLLHLPPHAPAGPDARITRTAGDVKIRKPSENDWDLARRGMDLFRAWRVGAADRAAAELTFRDDSRLGMRERTIVVIYGPEKRLAKIITATAELEEGTLEARLGELDGKPIVVRTPAGSADLRAGTAVVSSQPGGPSIVANHGGAAIPLRGRARTSGTVRVAAGMGSRVVPGKSPEPPRPLPPSPVWPARPAAWVALADKTAVTLDWSGSLRAISYRLAIVDAAGDQVAVATIASPGHAVTLDLAPGHYTAIASAFDADGFESIPARRAVEVLAGTIGGAATGPIAAGTEVVAPRGWTCRAGGDPAGTRVILASAGATTITCADGARTATPFVVDVMPIVLASSAGPLGDLVVTAGSRAVYVLEVASTGALGDVLVLEVSPNVHARVTRERNAFVVELDASRSDPAIGSLVLRAAGTTLVRRTIRIVGIPQRGVWLGTFASYLATTRDDEAGLGVRIGWRHRHLGAELSLGYGDVVGASARLDGVLRTPERTWVGLVGGGGVADGTAMLGLGGALAVALERFEVRLDLRGLAHHRDGWNLGAELQLALELRL